MTLRVSPVEAFRTTISTPGITAPVPSLTVPAILPVLVWVIADTAAKAANTTANNIRFAHRAILLLLKTFLFGRRPRVRQKQRQNRGLGFGPIIRASTVRVKSFSG